MMKPLSADLRTRLEAAIKRARRQAEVGARQALEGLGVQRRDPHESMVSSENELRKRLRAHGRQLGDVRDASGKQEISRLAHEVAYEHWHRMLFARFLTENQLLIEPESGVAISMAECEELARERGADPWALAGRFAQRMLPRIFRPDDPALEVALAPETRQALERLLESLPVEVFTADDSLGWTYQFWQTDRKNEVNASGVKIGADELPAVTQLFTEHYMVLFLFHNTIGAWHAGKILAENPSLAESAQSEEELRQAVRLRSKDGYEFEYLRFVRELKEGDKDDTATGPWRPAAGTFAGWPEAAKDIKVLDPCCGSGHFLVEGLELLVRLRMDEEGIDLEEAIRAVLTDNLHGLELDPRCTQIAAFNLAMTAWKLSGKPTELPPLHVASSGLAVGSTKREWTKLAGDDQRLRGAMERLYDLFEKAPELGSLIDPGGLEADLLQADFDSVQPFLASALENERGDEDVVERAVAARGMARAAELLTGKYTLVITNVPYLGRRAQTHVLKTFADEHHKDAKADLATIFVSQTFRWLGANGTQAVVTPQNWLFLTSYKTLREKLLRLRTWDLVVRLGEHAFENSSAAGAFAAMSVLSAGKPENDWQMACLNVSAPRGQRPIQAREKANLLRGNVVGPADTRESRAENVHADGALCVVIQRDQLNNPDARIELRSATSLDLLAAFATNHQGLSTGDNPRFRRRYWEVSQFADIWVPEQSATEETLAFSGRSGVLRWEKGKGQLYGFGRAHVATLHNVDRRGEEAWGKCGVGIRQMGELAATLYTGQHFDTSVAVLVPRRHEYLAAIWSFCESGECAKEIRAANPKVSVDNGYVTKVPFDISYWRKTAAEKYPNGLPEPQSNDPTQWLFHGHPTGAEPVTALQVAVGRLLGYRWPPELDSDIRLADDAREWVARCDALKEFADEDGIVCLTATRGEAGAADRLRRLLAATFGSDWSAVMERDLLAAAAENGKPAASLEEWLRDRFFEDHCKLFHHRPFVWHLWDGRKDGFHALLNYHRLAGPEGEGRRTLEALTYSYLGDWIARQKAEQREGREGADARLAAALGLQAQLERILAGEPPCDLFVRWKPLHLQPIGWEPDINDGVRLNIRPFMSVELRKGGRKGAGILRWKPSSINWKKDRGKEPQSLRPREDFPWFWSCPGEGTFNDRTDFMGGPDFDGNRWNDIHYGNANKRAARVRASEENS